MLGKLSKAMWRNLFRFRFKEFLSLSTPFVLLAIDSVFEDDFGSFHPSNGGTQPENGFSHGRLYKTKLNKGVFGACVRHGFIGVAELLYNFFNKIFAQSNKLSCAERYKMYKRSEYGHFEGVFGRDLSGLTGYYTIFSIKLSYKVANRVARGVIKYINEVNADVLMGMCGRDLSGLTDCYIIFSIKLSHKVTNRTARRVIKHINKSN